MPLYDFECSECKHTSERLVRSSVTTSECVKCGGKAYRLISGSQSFYFKGEGAEKEKSMNKVSTRGT